MAYSGYYEFTVSQIDNEEIEISELDNEMIMKRFS